MTKNIFYRKKLPYYILLFLLLSSLYLAVSIAGHRNRISKNLDIIDYVNSSTQELDSTFLNDLCNFMEVNLHHYMKQSIFGQFFTNTSSDPDFFTRIRVSATDSMRLQKNLKSLILYRTCDSALLSTLSIRTDFQEGNPAYAPIITAISSDKKNSPGFISTTDGDIFYYYPLHTPDSPDDLLGCAMIQLRFPKEFFSININKLNPKGTFVILNQNQLISVEGTNVLSTEIIGKIAKMDLPPNEIFTYHNSDIQPYNFYCIPSMTANLQYVYYEPVPIGPAYLWQLMKTDWFFPALLPFLTACIFFLISVYLTFWFRQDKERSLTQLKTAAAQLPASIQQVSPEALFPDTALPSFSGILIEYCSEEQNDVQLQTALCSSCEQYFSGCQIAYRLVAQPLYICCYINYSEYNMRVLSDSLKQILYNVSGNCRFTFYYTETTDSAFQMIQDMLYLQHSLHYTQIFGYARRYSLQIIRACDKSQAIFAENAPALIRKLLNEKKYDELISYLEEQNQKIQNIGHVMTAECYSYNSIYQFMEDAFFTLKEYFLEKSFSHPLSDENTGSLLQRYTGMQQFCSYLIQCISDYREANEQSISSHEQQFMEAVYLYIDGNLSSVTLNSMAEHFHITSAHLSRMFKKNTDQNFSEYLLEKKLTMAISLLEDSDKSINEISRELGYSTPAYFLSKFKERYDMTPSAYRKAYVTKTPRQ